MNETMIIAIIFGTMLTAGAVLLLSITFKCWYKYMIQEKRCTAETEGTVIRYTLTSRGPEGSGMHLPIVSYRLEGREYRVVGPEYKIIKSLHLATPFSRNSAAFEEDGQKLTINRRSNTIIGLYKNPMQELYPLGSRVKVYYDPQRPKLAYVKRYCDKKYAFWIGISGAALCIMAALSLFIFL